jgi:hypothetical protein
MRLCEVLRASRVMRKECMRVRESGRDERKRG